METVLIIEDEESYGEFLSKVVGKNYPFDWAKTADQAKAFLGAKQYDIVLYDLRIPGASGKELIRYVKEKVDPLTVNIVITGFEDDWPAVEATEEQVFFYMRKGRFRNEELLKVLASAAELRRLRRKEAEYVQKLVWAERLASAGKLAVSIAHEINNPLQGLMSIMDVLKRKVAGLGSQGEDGEPGSIAQDIAIMEKSVERIRRVVKQLTELHSMDEAIEQTDSLDAVVERVVSFIRPIAREKGTKLTARSSLGGEPVPVSEKQLFHVLLNTCMSLIDGGYASIDVKSAKRGGEAALEIATTRKDAREAPHKALEAPPEAVGHGLEIIRDLLHNLRGSMAVDRRSGGELITLTFPTRR